MLFRFVLAGFMGLSACSDDGGNSPIPNPGGVNGEVPADWAPDRTRPLCPFPAVARYSGEGDVERAENWACVSPRGNR